MGRQVVQGHYALFKDKVARAYRRAERHRVWASGVCSRRESRIVVVQPHLSTRLSKRIEVPVQKRGVPNSSWRGTRARGRIIDVPKQQLLGPRAGRDVQSAGQERRGEEVFDGEKGRRTSENYVRTFHNTTQVFRVDSAHSSVVHESTQCIRSQPLSYERRLYQNLTQLCKQIIVSCGNKVVEPCLSRAGLTARP